MTFLFSKFQKKQLTKFKVCKLLDIVGTSLTKTRFFWLQNVRINSKVSDFNCWNPEGPTRTPRPTKRRALCHLWPFEKNDGEKLGSKSFANTFQALKEIS